MNGLAVKAVQPSEVCFTKVQGLFQHRIEQWGEVAGRRVDDLQDFGGCGLPLERLARLRDQPRVVHRDDRLRRKVLNQRDLAIAEWSHLLAVHSDGAE